MVEVFSNINYFHLTIFLINFVLTYYYIIKKDFDKTMAAGLGALSTLVLGNILGIFDQGTFISEELGNDYLILAILFGNLLIVAVASEVGIFQFISVKILKATQGDPMKLYWALGLLTFGLSAVIGTIPAILIAGALTIVACNELELDPKAFIMMEIVVTNTGGLTTLISAITNLIIAIPFGITFIQFTLISAPLSIILFFISMKMMMRMYNIKEMTVKEEKIENLQSFNEWNFVKDKKSFQRTSIVFGITMILLLLSDRIGMEIAVIAVGGGLIMTFVSGKNLDNILTKLDWGLITFFASLFIIVKGLELIGVLELLTDLLLGILGNNNLVASLIMLAFSSIFSGILDNMVLAVAMTPILINISNENTNLKMGPLIWALIIGTNLGGGFTPIGAPPAVLGLGILYKETGTKVGWGEFIKTIGYVTLIRIIVSAFYLMILVYFIPDSFLV
ncbi:MAG: Arsenical pump membrane protein [Candidatus Heimdallarchaeota archaeon LC_2]|nr:MAG: Arsenical pump membrane protein [Candidatus Heimdallarchaeota archaeon LC_2]